MSEENSGKFDEARQLLENRTRLRPASLVTYISGLRNICEYADVNNPFEMIDKGLEWIEDITEDWIREHEHTLSPKHLNVVYSAVKTWCKATRVIKSRKLFREIDFDKTSRKTEALIEAMVTTSMVKQIFDIVKISDKIDIGLYALDGLRPSLIPQIRTIMGVNRCGFHPRSAHAENGKLIIDRKPAVLVITRLAEDSKPRRGNKANITFFVLVPTKLCELIETFVNMRNDVVTPDTRIADSHSEDAVYWKVKEAYRKIGFKGRPYLLRKFGDKILEIRTLLEIGKLTFMEFDNQLTEMTNQVLNVKIERKFSELFERELEKRATSA